MKKLKGGQNGRAFAKSYANHIHTFWNRSTKTRTKPVNWVVCTTQRPTELVQGTYDVVLSSTKKKYIKRWFFVENTARRNTETKNVNANTKFVLRASSAPLSENYSLF